MNRSRLGNGYRLVEDGFEILPATLSNDECRRLREKLSILYEQRNARAQTRKGGLRNLFRVAPEIAQLASSLRLKALLESRLKKAVVPIRALFFDKTAGANWRVPWHQDLTIPVVKKIEMKGFRFWTIKEGVVHVEPPQKILEGMATIRLHLDKCEASNGALRVVPGTHLIGKLNATQIAAHTRNGNVVVCDVSEGSALLMRPLLLHSSPTATQPLHRRVLDIQYRTDELPAGLAWFACK